MKQYRTVSRLTLAVGVVLTGLSAVLIPGALCAQGTPDVIRGRVIDDSARVVTDAMVSVTRGPDRLVQQTLTDSAGRYSVRFEEGTGDYLVHVAATGYKSVRRRVQADSGQHELVADFTLQIDQTILETVKVTAIKPARAQISIAGPGNRETGASEAWDEGVEGRLSPNIAGDLGALAGTIPGVTMTPGGASMLGAGPESNLTTINGMSMPGGSLPRAATANVRVTGATFDATRGGFAGANTEVRLGAGNRSFQQRRSFLTLNAPWLQSTDAVGRSLGVLNGGFRASLGADGEAIRETLVYNVAADLSRNSSTPATLMGNNDAALLRAGLSPDAARQVQSAANSLGIPLAGSTVPAARVSENLSFIGRLDDVRDTLRTLSLLAFGSVNRQGALGFGPLSSPASGGKSSQTSVGVQFQHQQFIGPGHFTVMQNRASGSVTSSRNTPYLTLPGASLLVRSASDAASSDVASVSVGGNPFLAGSSSQWTAEAGNDMIWNARGRVHRFKTALWLRADGMKQEGQSNTLGQYSYASLEDFELNRPSSYTRTLVQPDREASAYNAAAAFSHLWNPNRWFSAIWGLRLEGNRFGDTPPRNTALEQALGVRSGIAPSRLHVSPRAGFSYTYSRAKDNGSGFVSTWQSSWFRNTMGTIRGGIGEFRDLYKPGTLADAMVNAGLSGGAVSLSCVGAAVPVPDWQAMASGGGGTGMLPATCTDGSGVLAERAPTVSLVDPSFDVPRSWRATLGWSGMLPGFTVNVDALSSYSLSQPSTLDANFSGMQRFSLSGEGARPIYVSPASIDPGSGAISALESRLSPDYGRVSLRQSDLKTRGNQLTATLRPEIFFMRRNKLFKRMMFSASYTIQDVRQQFRGSDGANFGDPRTVEWAAGVNDARHAILFQTELSVPRVGAFTLFTRFQSGLPYTPIVQGDIDGDGRAGDRAFVPNPLAEKDAATRAQMLSLLAAAPGNVRECLESQLGQVAGRQSCRGPWTQTMNFMYRPNALVLAGHRATMSVVFENPLAGLDQIMHGSDNLRGWGSPAMPDPVLLVPRGFDAVNQRFSYDVNPRFGDTRPSRTLLRTPFRLVLDFSFDLSTPSELQTLRRALEPIKGRDPETRQTTWTRRGVDSIAALYLNRSSSSIYGTLLADSDSLFLSKDQIDALVKADSVYGTRVRSIYRSLAEFLATESDGKASQAALDSVNAATRLYWPLFWEQTDVVVEVLKPLQISMLPFLVDMIQVSPEERKTAKWFVGYPVSLEYRRPAIGGKR